MCGAIGEPLSGLSVAPDEPLEEVFIRWAEGVGIPLEEWQRRYIRQWFKATDFVDHTSWDGNKWVVRPRRV